MNLSKLFDMQRELDAKIIKEKGLEDMDRLPYLILALQVELGECANEWRGFKYWSKDREPRREVKKRLGYTHETKQAEDGHQYLDRVYEYETKYPLLEEYVDCLHFILSIGLNLQAEEWDLGDVSAFMPYGGPDIIDTEDVINHFIDVISYVNGLRNIKNSEYDYEAYKCTLEIFRGLGLALGFTWEQIEQAYISKNAVNHERQATGY